MSHKDKWVRRFSVDETAKHKNGFTIYKITSVLFLIESPETMTVVSVWKRFSDVQSLHKSMRALHCGLHLKGTFPELPKRRYFARFQKEVIEERSKCIKSLLEFIADHKLLFTSTDFVTFLQSGHTAPESNPGVITTIRASLQLPQDETLPLEYSDHDGEQSQSETSQTINDSTISQIPVFESQDIERSIPHIDSFESISSIDSSDDLYKELDKSNIDTKSHRLKNNLPDLINFDVPSTSKFEDYHTHETISISTTDSIDMSRSTKSTLSNYIALSLSNIECKTKTEDSYVFEAGHILNLAARFEDIKEYQKAFDYYKMGIEKMLIGVQSDSDPHRRSLIKQKTNKYLSYAENVFKRHLCGQDVERIQETRATSPINSLSCVRTLSVRHTLLLVLHQGDHNTRALKIIKKIPNNLTDEYFLHGVKDTREPILPRNIPYMVQLHSYLENSDLVFLLLTYAPGERLFDYIKNYTKSIPNTPLREVNLENVFTEPKTDLDNNLDDTAVKFDDNAVKLDEYAVKLDNNALKLDKTAVIIDEIAVDVKTLQLDIELNVDEVDCQNISIIDRIEANIENNNKNCKTESDETREIGDEISDLVKNSQKLLKNVDKVLSEVRSVKKSEIFEEKPKKCEERIETPKICLSPNHRSVLPPCTVSRWGAQILTAIEYLHRSGVVLIDLNPSNILLGNHGQIILTYFTYYPGEDMCLSKLRQREAKYNNYIRDNECIDLYIAPELYMLEFNDGVCDFWSFGVIMYELLCGVPLTYYHRSRFTSHTILQMPDGLPVEVQSLLTQLLTYDPSERLGGGKDGIEEIKSHPYFKQIDWQEILDSWVAPD